MTDRPLSPKDLEILSAYLDNQLGSREVKRLEARLEQNDGLRATLEDLRRTRFMLRSLPKVRAPRNFTLSPRMVGEIRRPKRSFWQLSSSWAMTSAISVMFLMITLMGDLMGAFTPARLVASGYAADSTNLAAEMAAMAEAAPEDVTMMAEAAPLESPNPEQQVELETAAIPAADPMAPEATDEATDPSAVTRAIEEPVGKAAGIDGTENNDMTLAKEASPSLFTPGWVRVIESVLLGLAVLTIALAIFWQRKL